MVDPFAGAHAAVAAWSTTGPASTSSPTDAGPAPAYLGSAVAVGVYVASLGALVGTYPPTGYPRHLEYLSCKCSHSGLVELFVGAISDIGRLSTYGDGSASEYEPVRPRLIPQGMTLYVVWTVPDATHSASATAGLREVS